MKEKIRIAQLSDEPEVMLLLNVMHAEGGIMPLDCQQASAMFHRAFNRQGGILAVIGEPGDIKAMIYLLISRFWYSSNYHLEELFNFVRPDMRTSKENYARRLIEFAKESAVEIGLPLTIGVLTNQRMEGKVRLYQRELGVPAGAWFVHNSKWQNEAPNAEFWKEPFPKKGRVATGKDLRLMRKVS
jgi:hypothetical protein